MVVALLGSLAVELTRKAEQFEERSNVRLKKLS